MSTVTWQSIMANSNKQNYDYGWPRPVRNYIVASNVWPVAHEWGLAAHADLSIGREGFIPFFGWWQGGIVYLITPTHRIYRSKPRGWRHDIFLSPPGYRARIEKENVGFGLGTWFPNWRWRVLD
jgi:hypothetical protein